MKEIAAENRKHMKKLKVLLLFEGSCCFGEDCHHTQGKGRKEKVTVGTQCLLCPFQFKSYKY